MTFVQNYLKIPKIEAAGWLARKYGIETERKETAQERKEREEREQARRRKEAWEHWQRKALRTLVTYHQLLKDGRKEGKVSVWCKYDAFFEEYVRCLLDDPVMFYRLYRKELRKIENRLRELDC